MLGISVQGDRFKHFMRLIQDRAARRFVHAAGLHPHKAVLHHIHEPDTVLSAQFVQRGHHLHSVFLFAVQRYGNAFLESDGQKRRLVGGFHRGHAHLQEPFFVILRHIRRIFQIQPFVRKVPQVLVLAVIRLAVDLQRYVVCFRVFDLLFSRLDIPDPPGRNDLHVGCERLDGEFKPHLVVPLARTTVTNRVRAFAYGDLRQFLGDDRSGKRRSQKVLSFVHRARFERRIDVFFDENFFQIHDDQFACARLDRFFFQIVQFARLSHVAADRDDLRIVVVFFQPRYNNGRIQSARIRQHDFFDFFVSCHFFLLLSSFFGTSYCILPFSLCQTKHGIFFVFYKIFLHKIGLSFLFFA